jgi:hypothetical protein
MDNSIIFVYVGGIVGMLWMWGLDTILGGVKHRGFISYIFVWACVVVLLNLSLFAVYMAMKFILGGQ